VPVHPLPEDPSLENLKKRAKSLLRAVRAGELRAVAAFRELHPRAETALARSEILNEAPTALARLTRPYPRSSRRLSTSASRRTGTSATSTPPSCAQT